MKRPATRDLFLGGRVYWLCQLAGWGGYAAEGMVSDVLWSRWNADTVVGTLSIAGSGLLVSHGCRAALQRAGWTSRPLRSLPWLALLATVLMATAWMGAVEGVRLCLETLSASGLNPWLWAMITLYALLLSGGWNALYFAYHAARRLLIEQEQARADRWRLQAALSDAQFQALKAQLHPHFLFNALNGLRTLVDEDPARAREAVTRLSNLLRYSLQASAAAAVPLSQELAVVDDYLGLESIRLESRLRVRREVDEAALPCPVPPLSVQMLVENAVKYGVAPFRAPQEITLTVRLDAGGGMLRVEIGNGAAPEGEAPPHHDSPGLGLANLRERLARLGGERAGVRVTHAPGGRVVAEMIVPVGPETSVGQPAAAVPRPVQSRRSRLAGGVQS